LKAAGVAAGKILPAATFLTFAAASLTLTGKAFKIK
jgi:hypothetical protein